MFFVCVSLYRIPDYSLIIYELSGLVSGEGRDQGAVVRRQERTKDSNCPLHPDNCTL